MRPLLVVEDDRRIARVVALYLGEAGYRVDDKDGHLVLYGCEDSETRPGPSLARRIVAADGAVAPLSGLRSCSLPECREGSASVSASAQGSRCLALLGERPA